MGAGSEALQDTLGDAFAQAFPGVTYLGTRSDNTLIFNVALAGRELTYSAVAGSIASYILAKHPDLAAQYRVVAIELPQSDDVAAAPQPQPAGREDPEVSPQLRRAWNSMLFGAAATLAAFILGGIAYFFRARLLYDPFHCIYGEPTCGTAVATYAIAIFTACAFIAAGAAAFFTYRTMGTSRAALEHERQAELGERASSGQSEHCLTLTLEAVERFRVGPPYDPDEYEATHFGFLGLGRSAIRDASLRLICTWQQSEPSTKVVAFGSLPADGKVDVTLIVLP